MAGAVAGVGVGFGLSCSTTKLSHRHPSSSSSSSTKTTRRCCVKMAVSLDEKKKNYTLQKSEEAFAVAKVFLFFFIPISIHSNFYFSTLGIVLGSVRLILTSVKEL